MPTVPAPTSSDNSNTKLPERPTTPPPQPMSPAQQVQKQRSNSGIFIVIAIIIFLCAILGYVLYTMYHSNSSVAAPVLTNLPQYTNTAAVTIQGTAPARADITILMNGQSTATGTADSSGNFQVSVPIAQEGTYTFSATAQKRVLFTLFTSPLSNTVSTIVDRTAPSLKIITPPSTVKTNTYVLKGSVSEPATVTITVNGKDITVQTDKNNAFSATITLIKGTNTIVVTATDRAGNKTTSAAIKTSYAVQSTPTTTTTKRKNLPKSAGDLATALNTLFIRYLAIGAVILATLGFAASTSGVWLFTNFKKQ